MAPFRHVQTGVRGVWFAAAMSACSWAGFAAAQGGARAAGVANDGSGRLGYVAVLIDMEAADQARALRSALEREGSNRGFALISDEKVQSRLGSTPGDPVRDPSAAQQLRSTLGALSVLSITAAAVNDELVKVQIKSVSAAGERVERWSGPPEQLVEAVVPLVGNLLASTPPPSAPPAPVPVAGPATQGWDVVVLGDGTTLYGRVLQQVPGSYVVFALPDGRQQTFAWTAVRSVSTVPGGAPTPAAGATVVDPRTGISYAATQDCSNSTDERCQQRTNLGAGQGGFSASMSGQSVRRRLEPPPSYDLGFALEANFMYGKSTKEDLDLTLIGGGWLLGIRGMFGGQFPGPEGGSWSGLGLDAALHVQGGSGSVDVGGESYDFKLTTTTIGGQIGYQYLHFGTLDETDLEQGGVGLFLGARVSYQSSETEDGGDGGSGVAYGPALSLSFPDYNAGTTSLTRWTISALALYIEDFLLVSAGAGYTW